LGFIGFIFISEKWKNLRERETMSILEELREKSRFVEWNKDERREYYGIMEKMLRY